MNNLVGRICYYRPLFHAEMKESKVVHVEEVESWTGVKMPFVTLENGEKVDPTSCYFSLSATA